MTAIPDRAFQGCEALTSVQVSENLVSIGASAFQDCQSLEAIRIPAGVTRIGADAFHSCYALTGFDVAEGNTAYQAVAGALLTGDGSRLLAYAASSPTERFDAPETLTQVDREALCHIRYLKTLVLPEGFSAYDAGMFEDSTGIEEIRFGEGTLTAIPDRFFKGCASLTAPTDFSGVTSVGYAAFQDCASLPSVSFDGALTDVGISAFQGCASLTGVTLPDTLDSMGAAAFQNASALESFTMPAAMAQLPSAVFRGCSALRRVQWSESLTWIGANAFENTGLTSVEFPEGLRRIGAFSFSGAANLRSVVFPAGLSQIDSSAFAGTGLESVALPEGLTSLGSGAFGNCSSLTAAALNSGMTVLPTATFENCAVLSALAFPEGLTEIGDRALAGCVLLRSVETPRSLRRVGSKAFENCRALPALLLRPEVVRIEEDAFSGCESITIRGWVGSVAHAVAQAAPLPFAAMDAPLQFVANAAGDGMLLSFCDPNAVTLSLPASVDGLPVTGLADGALSACAFLRDISVDPASEFLSVRDGVLYGDGGERLLLYPAGRENAYYTVQPYVRSVAPYAFSGCAALRKVVVGSQVGSIGDNALDALDEAFCLIVKEGSAAEAWAVAAGIPHAAESTQFSYRVAGGEAWITGYLGEMPEVIVPAALDGYPVRGIEAMHNDILRSVVVSEGVVEIGERAFVGDPDSSRLERVVLPDSVVRLGPYAFSGQARLREVSLGYGLTEIGPSAFGNCHALRSLALPDSLVSIGTWAFGSTGLESLYIPVGVSSLEDGFLRNCESFRTLLIAPENPYFDTENGLTYENATNRLIFTNGDLPGAVTVREGTETIGTEAFKNRAVSSVWLPDSVTAVNAEAFSGCADLSSIRLSANLEKTGTFAFAYCGSLGEIQLPDSLTAIDDYAFYYCTGLTSIDIPAGVSRMQYALSNCTSLRSVTLHPGLLRMENNFSCCWALDRLSLPEGLQVFRKSFFLCDALTALSLPASLETFDVSLPPSVKAVASAPGAVRYVSENDILYDTRENTLLFVNETVCGDVTIRDGITAIGGSAFISHAGLTSVWLPESCTVIGDNAFSGCSSLTSVHFPDSLTEIGRYAFQGTGLTGLSLSQPHLQRIGGGAFSECPSLANATITTPSLVLEDSLFLRCGNLRSAVLPSAVSFYGPNMFNGCSALTSVTLPQNITSIGGFSNCASLASIDIPASVTSVDYSAFAFCTSLTQVHLPDGGTGIGEQAFTGCEALTEIHWPASLRSIGPWAFAQTDLRAVTIPSSVTEIAPHAFSSLPNLETIALHEGITAIGEAAFAGAGRVRSVALPENLRTLGDQAFSGAPLITVYIPGSVQRIGEGAFGSCAAMESVSIAPGVEEIGPYAFSGCEKLVQIILPATVSTVGEGAFSGCSSLTGFGGAARFTSVEEVMFSGCEKLEWINVSPDVTAVPANAFAGCVALERVSSSAEEPGVVLPNVQWIGDYAFSDCRSVPSFAFGDALTSVGDYAFGNTQITSFSFPDSVTDIGICVFWRNTALNSVRLPAGLTRIPQTMFSFARTMETLTIPDGVKAIGPYAFSTNAGLGALKLPDGLERIEQRAFSQSTIVLEIPASVTYIADDAFYDSDAIFYAAEGSCAHQYALNHGIPVCVDERLSEACTRPAREMAQAIVDEVISADMTDYQKAEALLDWLLDNCVLDDNLDHTRTGKLLLIRRLGHSLAWAYAYQALLDAAHVDNRTYNPDDESGEQGSGSASYSLSNGIAFNHIRIDGEWYLTSLPRVERFGKEYFMMNRDLYLDAFHEDPGVERCDGYLYTYFYQEYGKHAEESVVAQASAAFAEGRKLAWVELPPELSGNPLLVDYFGRHMDTLEWRGANGAFEPGILGAEVTILEDLVCDYGEALRTDITQYTAVLCGMNVTGQFQVEPAAGSAAVTGPTTVSVTFTPALAQYADTLEPTVLEAAVQCRLPALTGTCQTGREGLSITVDDHYPFFEQGQLELIFTPGEGEEADRRTLTVEDSAALYRESARFIPFSPGLLDCGTSYEVAVVRKADGYLPSAPSVVATMPAAAHEPVVASLSPATREKDGCLVFSCGRCGEAEIGTRTVDHARVTTLPDGTAAVGEEAFCGLMMEQVVLPEGITEIGPRAFADCPRLCVVVIPARSVAIADDAFENSGQVVLVCPERSSAQAYAEQSDIPCFPLE